MCADFVLDFRCKNLCLGQKNDMVDRWNFSKDMFFLEQ